MSWKVVGRVGYASAETKKPRRCEAFVCGTRGRTRTGTLLRAGDFESPVYTNFTTLALIRSASVDQQLLWHCRGARL